MLQNSAQMSLKDTAEEVFTWVLVPLADAGPTPTHDGSPVCSQVERPSFSIDGLKRPSGDGEMDGLSARGKDLYAVWSVPAVDPAWMDTRLLTSAEWISGVISRSFREASRSWKVLHRSKVPLFLDNGSQSGLLEEEPSRRCGAFPPPHLEKELYM